MTLHLSEPAAGFFRRHPEGVDYEVARRVVGAMPCAEACPCTRHGGDCQVPAVEGAVAGSPCTLWSQIGLRRGASDRSIMLLFDVVSLGEGG